MWTDSFTHNHGWFSFNKYIQPNTSRKPKSNSFKLPHMTYLSRMGIHFCSPVIQLALNMFIPIVVLSICILSAIITATAFLAPLWEVGVTFQDLQSNKFECWWKWLHNLHHATHRSRLNDCWTYHTYVFQLIIIFSFDLHSIKIHLLVVYWFKLLSQVSYAPLRIFFECTDLFPSHDCTIPYFLITSKFVSKLIISISIHIVWSKSWPSWHLSIWSLQFLIVLIFL